MGGIRRDQLAGPGAATSSCRKSILGPSMHSMRSQPSAVSATSVSTPLVPKLSSGSASMSGEVKSRIVSKPATLSTRSLAPQPASPLLLSPSQCSAATTRGSPSHSAGSPAKPAPRSSPRGGLSLPMSTLGGHAGMAEALGFVSSDARSTSAGASSNASGERSCTGGPSGAGAPVGGTGPVLPPEVATDIPGPDPLPWIEAARTFPMNSDFDISVALGGRSLTLEACMTLMKAESAGKWTIQALGDKITLHKMVRNLGIPQMPALLIVEGPGVNRPQVESCVKTHLFGPHAHHIVVKPSHMSNVEGVIFVSPGARDQEPNRIADVIEQHMIKFLAKQASPNESAALRSLRPGFIVQPKYESFENYSVPLELRVVVIWGKARVAVWWWGRHGSPNSHPERNVWLVRQTAYEGELNDEDAWEVVHLNPNPDAAFEAVLEQFEKNIVIIAKMAEVVAHAVGAPFLRSDFFLGSPQWGVRLNEVAYGSGIDYFNIADDGSDRIVNDGPMIARIIQEGMENCQKRTKAAHFLSTLGVQGPNYASMYVVPSNDIHGQEMARANNRPRNSNGHGLVPLTLPRRQHHKRHNVKAPSGRLELSPLWNQGHFFLHCSSQPPPPQGAFEAKRDQVATQKSPSNRRAASLPPQDDKDELRGTVSGVEFHMAGCLSDRLASIQMPGPRRAQMRSGSARMDMYPGGIKSGARSFCAGGV